MTDGARLRILIVDDDALARRRIHDLLVREADITIAGECADGTEAVVELDGGGIDLVFLDVQMPGLDGFGVLETIGAARMPPVIFTSAYSEFAVRAFEAYAIDYLLKPFDDARFATALARAREQVAARRVSPQSSVPGALDPRLAGLLEHLQRPQPTKYAEAIAVKTGDQYVMLRVADIEWIEADGNYAKLHAGGRARLISRTLATLEHEVLDPDVFVRVHRSAIVNTTRVVAAEPLFHGELTLVLRDGSRVQCSRRHRKDIEGKFYFTS